MSGVFGRLAAVLLVLGLVPLAPSPAHAVTLGTSRASVASGGEQADGGSARSVISADGRYVVFQSSASNLATGYNRWSTSVFRRDTVAGETTLVGHGQQPSVSADGRFVAYLGIWGAVTLKDMSDGQTVVVSRSVAGGEADGNHRQVSVTGDGRFVVFVSDADDLVTGDSNRSTDVFRYDRLTDTVERVNLGPDGSMVSRPLHCAASGDGRYVAFDGYYTRSNGHYDAVIVVRDLRSGDSTIVSPPELGWTGGPLCMSSDGRFVAYEAGVPSGTLYPEALNVAVCVSDRETGQTQVASVPRVSAGPDFYCESPAISGSGRYVAFMSDATCLVPGDTTREPKVFVRDMLAGHTTLGGLSSTWSPAEGSCGYPSLSGDGRYLTFTSPAANLVPGDTNGVEDVFVRDTQAQEQDVVLSVSSPLVSAGARTLLSASVTTPLGAPLGGHTVVFERSIGASWSVVATGTTNPCSVATACVTPLVNSVYRARVLATEFHPFAQSEPASIAVAAVLSAPSVPHGAATGTAFEASGYLKPRHASGTYPVVLSCYHYSLGSWTLVKTVRARVTTVPGGSIYRASVVLPSRGVWRIRASHSDEGHVASVSCYSYLSAWSPLR